MLHILTTLGARTLNALPPAPWLLRLVPPAVVVEAIQLLHHEADALADHGEAYLEELDNEIAAIRSEVDQLAAALHTRQGAV